MREQYRQREESNVHKEQARNALVEAEARGLLLERDRQIIQESLVRLTEHLARNPKRFPDLVVFPDVGARVFVYAVKPIIDRLADQYKRSRPRYRFIVVHSDDVAYHASALSYMDEDSVVVELTETTRDYVHDLEQEEGEQSPNVRNARQHLEYEKVRARKAHQGARLQETRASEMYYEGKSEHILVVDDYLDSGKTFSQLVGSFAAAGDTQPDITYFPFYKSTEGDEVQSFSGVTLVEGCKGSVRDFASFSFLRKFGFSPESRDEDRRKNRKRIGVTKELDDMYAQAFRPQDAPPYDKALLAEGKILREAMRQIGERVCASMIGITKDQP